SMVPVCAGKVVESWEKWWVRWREAGK
nr:hypothetical protein [Tanacetum cinerariifolium]